VDLIELTKDETAIVMSVHHDEVVEGMLLDEVVGTL